MRILFTGGSGKAGRHVVPYLVSKGHRVTNLDLVDLDCPGVTTLKADITDSGQVWNALTMYAGFDEMQAGQGVQGYDAVVHFAAVPRILIHPDNETFRVNTIGTYNVIEAAVKLGIRKVIFASSETTYGVCFASGTRQPEYLPIDEDHPTLPEDSYAMSKVCNEGTARSFQARTGADIYGLRINNVMEPQDYAEKFPDFIENPDQRLRNFFAYIDARDLGQIVDRCLATDGLGYQVFNASNDDHSVNLTTPEILARHYEGVPVRGDLGEHETLYSNRKAREMLGFAQEHPWRRYLDDPRGKK
ncbi:NAD-dependent epimerase/dehydratase family protein [Oceaniglobus trochenteri]|uniref:NAD-dependent epimerase/dehydratase family protein n=1 Tax=Oceaniglobus trochenteri TaxID=2763260 RepID=UPI001CFFCA7E|nr:NAD(P)-dependent oxidoreductase [Oceaniglobus trochenteri]